ncbi:class I SAM-dependent methyltransferase [Mycobacterium spongiae]|uniref:Uncharacterized protein n=1 Tax=Mycobacterium spongiae TaxID=886343 RepID=A0A975JXQ0_9MYCO|nr:hypothetical protein [Mycobacterium spongiae]QUR67622.1 hypothetical protein F6B93_11380 [Mycobacterium spongiae]
MPHQIDRNRAHELSPRIDEALEIVCNEFAGLDTHQQYRNAFSRVLKPDPLDRVMMMGTDQRDLFIPLLRQTIVEHVPVGGHIFDIGAGDGQTFAFVADAVPQGTTVSIAEPNPGYLADYVSFLERQPHLHLGVALQGGVEHLDHGATDSATEPPAEQTVDLALGLHMLYFAADPQVSLEGILRLVATGGVFFNVITDELTGFAGVVQREFIKAGGDPRDGERQLAILDERRRLLAPQEEGGGGLAPALRAAGIDVAVSAVRQPSRHYGHTLADLLALAKLNLADVASPLNFEIAAKTLRDRSEEIGLRIETDGPRIGMWSVSAPQWVTRVRRNGG